MKTIRQRFRIAYTYPTVFTRDVFQEGNPALRSVFPEPGQSASKILAVIDSGVFHSTPGLLEKMERYVKGHPGALEMVSFPHVMKGGEDCKRNPEEIKKVTWLIHQHHLCRHSYVLA